MRLVDRGVIFDATRAPANARAAFFTHLYRSTEGRILAAFEVGTTKHSADSTIGIYLSDDGGIGWQPLEYEWSTSWNGVPGSLAAPALIETPDGALHLFVTWMDRSDPDRPMFDPVTQGILHTRQLRAQSSDGGRSWSPWQEIATPGLSGCAMTGPLLLLDEGLVLFPFESFKEYDDPRPGRHAAWLMISRDHCRTFSPPRLVAQHPEHKVYYWDQRLCRGNKDGEVFAFFWTHDLEKQRDLPVHYRRLVVTAEGVEAGSIQPTTITGQIAAPIQLANGDLFAFVVDRNQPATMSLYRSIDEGETWPERLEVYQHDEEALLSQGQEQIDFNQYWEDMGKWSFGHPALVPVGPTQLLVSWYAGSPDCLSIHWGMVEVASESSTTAGGAATRDE